MTSRPNGLLGDPWSTAQAAADELARRTGAERHDVFVVLGSGWAHVAELLMPAPGGAAADAAVGGPAAGGPIEVPMVELPGFPAPSALGHGGAFRSIDLDGHRLLLALGRIHLYEGHGPLAVAHGVRTAAAAGCRTVVLTNAAGSLHREWPLGRPVVLRDQINFTGASPLTGANPPAGLPGRFTDMTEVYTARLRSIVHEVEPGLPEGVYTGFHGPEFETPAEIEMSRRWGGDLVGMSTVLEAIAASHLGLDVLGLSLATNLAAGMGDGRLDGDHVIAVAKANAPYVGDLLLRILRRIVEATG